MAGTIKTLETMSRSFFSGSRRSAVAVLALCALALAACSSAEVSETPTSPVRSMIDEPPPW